MRLKTQFFGLKNALYIEKQICGMKLSTDWGTNTLFNFVCGDQFVFAFLTPIVLVVLEHVQTLSILALSLIVAQGMVMVFSLHFFSSPPPQLPPSFLII